LIALQNFKLSNPSIFESIGTKGIEHNSIIWDDSLAIRIFKEFKIALEAKQLLEADSLSANSCYIKLLRIDPENSVLKIMKRELAAALQDEVQQILNKILLDDPYEINEWRRGSIKYQKYVDYLQRSMELLGRNHYRYNSLVANKLFLESYNLSHCSTFTYHYYPDSIRKLGRLKLYEALQYKDDAMINYLLGNSFQNTVYVDSVNFYYQKAMELAPQWKQPYSEIAWYYLDQLSDYPATEKCLHKGLEIDSNSYGLLEMLAWLYQRYNKIDSVETICKRMRKLHPDLPNDYITLAYTYTYLTRNYELAEINFNLSELIQPTLDEHSKWILGDIERNTKRLENSKKHTQARDFSEIYFGDLMVFTNNKYNLYELLSNAKQEFEIESDPAFKFNALVKQCIVSFHLNDYERALSILLNAISNYYVPTASPSLAYGYLGLVNQKIGSYSEAEGYFNMSINFKPFEYSYQNKPLKSCMFYFFGSFLLDQNQLAEAEKKFQVILNKDYGCIFGFYGMARLCAKRNQKDQALDSLEHALDLYFPIPEPILEEPLFTKIKGTKRFKSLMKKHFNLDL